ncbi:MAG: biotin transporter BioY [Oscillospiraceae bacterium]|jgi:biotin transport system substrate-specific component|nr:biotin transporter BioY [Oscillospiraceae bacterium]
MVKTTGRKPTHITKPFPAIRITRVALAAAMVVIATFIRFPLGFAPVMFTAQVYMVLTVGLLLGAVDGVFALAVYLLIGLMGMPVFSRGGGFGALATPEGGYLLGFVAAAGVSGWISGMTLTKEPYWEFIAAFAGVAACYAIALPFIAIQQAILGNPVAVGRLFAVYFLAFMPLDSLKAVLAALTTRGLRRAAPSLFTR